MTRKPFGQQKGGQRKATLALLKKTITDLSGGDERDLLEALLASRYCRRAATQPIANSPPMHLKAEASVNMEAIPNGETLQDHQTSGDPSTSSSSSSHPALSSSTSSQSLSSSSSNILNSPSTLSSSSSSISLTSSNGGLRRSQSQQRGLLDAIQDAQTKLNKILDVLLSLYKKEKNHNKKQWSSIVSVALKYDEMREFGFPISRQSYARARAHSEESGPGTPSPSNSSNGSRKSDEKGSNSDGEGDSPLSIPNLSSSSSSIPSGPSSSNSSSSSTTTFVDHGYAGVSGLVHQSPFAPPFDNFAYAASSALAAINNPGVIPVPEALSHLVDQQHLHQQQQQQQQHQAHQQQTQQHQHSHQQLQQHLHHLHQNQ